VNQKQVYLNRGNFVFEDISDRAFPGKTEFGTPTEGFVLRDLNKDGRPDLFLSSSTFREEHSPNAVWLGVGDGTFVAYDGIDFTAMVESARKLVIESGKLPSSVDRAHVRLYQHAIIPLERKDGSYDFVVPLELLAAPCCSHKTTVDLVLATPGHRFGRP
jgi:hypothetical protein